MIFIHMFCKCILLSKQHTLFCLLLTMELSMVFQTNSNKQEHYYDFTDVLGNLTIKAKVFLVIEFIVIH